MSQLFDVFASIIMLHCREKGGKAWIAFKKYGLKVTYLF